MLVNLKSRRIPAKSQTAGEIRLLSAGHEVSIPVSEIVYIGRKGLDVCVHTKEKAYKTPLSVREILDQLEVPAFFRVHRSYIICLRRVSTIRKKELWLGSFRVPISVYYRQQLVKVLADELNKQLSFFEG